MGEGAPPGTWAPISSAGAPAARFGHTAIWTGAKLIVWGGYTSDGYAKDGFLYDPSTDAWSPVSTTAAPTARQYHTATWTGSEMIIWGGTIGGDRANTGGRFRP